MRRHIEASRNALCRQTSLAPSYPRVPAAGPALSARSKWPAPTMGWSGSGQKV